MHHEPGPPRAEVSGSVAGEGRLEVLVTPERGHDRRVQVPAGLAASVRRERVPVQVVVIDLGVGMGRKTTEALCHAGHTAERGGI